MADLVARIAGRLRELPLFFADIARDFGDVPWRDLLRAWGEVRRRFTLERDEDGHYHIIPGAAAKPKGRARAASSPRATASRQRREHRR